MQTRAAYSLITLGQISAGMPAASGCAALYRCAPTWRLANFGLRGHDPRLHATEERR